MADEDDEAEEMDDEAGDNTGPSLDGDGDEDEGEPPKRGGRAKLFIIIGAVVFLLIGGGAGAYLMGYLDSLLGIEEAGEEEEFSVTQGEVFFKLEDITLNLHQEGKKSKFLKIGITLVLLHEGDVTSMEYLTPRIVDYVATYLRELRSDEVIGSANFVRIRENILLRVRAAVAPIQVTNILFNSVLVQ